MLYDQKTKKFKELLEDEHDFPGPYIFKFIVPASRTNEVEALFPGEKIELRASRKGNYVSATITIHMESSDLVIAIYEQASRIHGLIAL
ncbi:MAG: DUF493 domain-containing protein [Pseudobdellovibrionaceae bacterium]|nr:DUF493 domain-containing protein [Bdellovibrionales bacterium]USN48262.1 MAG: DUF493 domain-containing protein [Pseudobdellovibrionaceae bacterium]